MASFRHVVLMRFKEDATDAQIEDMIESLAKLPSVIPEIVSYKLGRDAGVNQGNYDLGIVADFADRDDYVVYRDHPEHRAIITAKVQPILAERAAVQYEL